MKNITPISLLALALSTSAFAGDWLSWRGPFNSGVSAEHYKKAKLSETPAWTYESHGRGTPVICDGKVFSWGYLGEKEELVEVLTALDEKTGKKLWEVRLKDFISDTVYNRYSIGSPAVDPLTKRVYLLTSYGVFGCWDFDGKEIWRHSLMEEIGRMTFPNSKVGCPVIEGDLVIVRGITSNWGADGPAADRFYAYDKMSGQLVWTSLPGESPPKDSSFSNPVFETRDGKRVFYAGTGCGNIVCVNARNGKPLWRHKMSKGGVNNSPMLYKDTVIMIHGEENPDTADKGRLLAVKVPQKFGNEQIIEDPEIAKDAWQAAEVWRTHLRAETSSPVLAGNHIYLVDDDGNMVSANADTGEEEWELQVAAHNIHSSPLVVDGLIYFVTEQGKLTVVKPGDKTAEIVQQIKLDGIGLAQPAVINGRLFVHTQNKFYCFKIENSGVTTDKVPVAKIPKAGPAAGLQIIPPEFVVSPGSTAKFKLRSVDANGFVVGPVTKASWDTFIPPTAKVKAKIEDAKFNDANELVANADAKPGAGAFKATAEGGIFGIVRGRVLAKPPFKQDFEKYELTEEFGADADNPAYKYAYPPLPWIGARFKFQVMEVDGNKVLGKSFDRLLFQRATVFMGAPDMKDYTVQADVMTDGSRRGKSDVGIINQRYAFVLKGNANELEVSSNYERLKRVRPFKIEPKKWYTLKSQVKVDADGINGTLCAKAWEKGTPEPEAWTLEEKVNPVHTQGCPGLFGFTPQNQKRVYIDNIQVTPNQ
ncbi:MAG: hypothetical protein JWO89_3572 [Verrucomicrobiaceae bacterium]|nr:hypothetical protein [Verrucomicrobiaceae bacterium]